MSTADLIIEVVAAAGGQVVGRVRLQKMIFLLNALGIDTGAKFTYHHYGPFSRDVDEAISAAKAAALISEMTARRASDGVPFSIFKINDFAKTSNDLDARANYKIDFPALIKEMDSVSSTILEIAATIRWLAEEENYPEWRGELRKRKGLKAEGGRIEAALLLLERIGLPAIIAEPA